jgi:nucleoside-diphosphate-sugar epimerase
VRDAASLLKHVIAKASQDAPVFNGASGEERKVASVVDSIYRYLSCEQIPVYNKKEHRGNPHRLCANINRALSTGWRPRVEFESALNDFVKWVKDVNHV